MTISDSKSTVGRWDSFKFLTLILSCVAPNVCLHLGKKKKLFSQVIGETFLSSAFYDLLRRDWSFLWKAVPTAGPGFPAWCREVFLSHLTQRFGPVGVHYLGHSGHWAGRSWEWSCWVALLDPSRSAWPQVSLLRERELSVSQIVCLQKTEY